MSIEFLTRNIFRLVARASLVLCVLIVAGESSFADEYEETGKIIDELEETVDQLEKGVDEEGRSTVIELPQATEPTAEGDYGKIQIVFREYVNKSVQLRNNYIKELQDIGWFEILNPERLKKDVDLKNSKDMVNKITEAFDNYSNQMLMTMSVMVASVKDLDIDEFAKENVLKGIDKANKNGSKIEMSLSLEKESINEVAELINFLDAKPDAWVVEDSQLKFYKEADLKEFNSHLLAIEQINQKKKEFVEQSIKNVRSIRN